MKKLAIITAFVAIICFGMTTATAQNHNTVPAITEFVNTYFPKTNIAMLNTEWDEYEVRLNDGTELKFTRSCKWKKIDCEHSSLFPSVPAELVPERITAYVNTNFADQRITKIEQKYRGWEVELSNELEIKFNKNCVVIKIDD